VIRWAQQFKRSGVCGLRQAGRAGRKPIATTSEINGGFVKELGADRVIDYTDEPFDSFVYDVDDWHRSTCC
jgi:NADPH:quinone reductase-like Zn-dependent oxidoreductase